jgi:hypothetical protein
MIVPFSLWQARMEAEMYAVSLHSNSLLLFHRGRLKPNLNISSPLSHEFG